MKKKIKLAIVVVAMMGATLCLCAFKGVLKVELTPLVADALSGSKVVSQLLQEGELAVPSEYKWWFFTKNNDGLPSKFHMPDEPFIDNPKYKGNGIPSREGMENLNMSGSAQFSEGQLPTMIRKFQEKNPNKIYMIDCCQESKLFIDGDAAFYYGAFNLGNLGRNVEQVLNNEKLLKEQTKNSTVDFYRNCDKEDAAPIEQREVGDNVKTEKEICEEYGIEYVRIPCPDHVFPDSSAIDYFIQYVKDIPSDSWMHVHCSGGISRTTIFMIIYDIMKNPTVSLDDIVGRQCLYERAWLYQERQSEEETFRNDLYKEKTVMIRKVYQYIMQNRELNYRKSYAQFLTEID